MRTIAAQSEQVRVIIEQSSVFAPHRINAVTVTNTNTLISDGTIAP